MRPTKTARHLSADPVTNHPVIARHRKTFKAWTPPTVTFHKPRQTPEELGHKGRGMNGR